VLKRSVDTLDIAHIYPLRKHFLRDYRRIIEVFPLLDALCWLYDAREDKPHWSKL
jgi:hypothetical protein